MSKIKCTLLFLSFLSFSSAQNDLKSNNQNKESLELQVIASIIDELIVIHPTLPPPPFPDKDSTKREGIQIEYQKVIEEYQRKKDTTNFKLYFKKVNSEAIQFLQNLHDTSYFSLAKKLKNKSGTTALDWSKMSNKDFEITNAIPKNWEIQFEFLGIASFSDIVFNDDHSLALFYYSFVCGGLCGSGHYIVVKKLNNRWVIIKNDIVWVS